MIQTQNKTRQQHRSQVKRIQKPAHHLSWKEPAPGQVRVYVWEWPVRFSHWVLVFTIISLSITGYYMHSPYIVARGHTAYVMGSMRFIHILSGYAFLLAMRSPTGRNRARPTSKRSRTGSRRWFQAAN